MLQKYLLLLEFPISVDVSQKQATFYKNFKVLLFQIFHLTDEWMENSRACENWFPLQFLIQILVEKFEKLEIYTLP